MPHELAYNQIASQVNKSEEALIHGAEIFLRDGLPALKIHNGDGYSHLKVAGYLLYSKDDGDNLISTARAYEGSNYRLAEVKVSNGDGVVIDALTFAGAKIDQSNPEPWEGKWSSANSPLLGYGYPNLIQNLRLKDLRVPEKLGPSDYWTQPEYWRGSGTWPGLLRIEGDYLTLTSVFEYVLSLRFGRAFGHEVMRRIEAIAVEPEMQQAYESCSFESKWDVRDVSSIASGKASPTNLRRALDSCYTVRNNLTHRGKSVKSDAAKVIEATKLLSKLLTAYLLIVLPDLREIWPEEILRN